MKRTDLTKLTDMQLARLFVSVNESSFSAPMRNYLEISREANRVRAYGQQVYGNEQWQHLVNRVVVNR